MRLRTILLLILALLLVVPLVAAVGLWWIDRDTYRRLIAEQVEQATGRKLTLGDIGFDVSLHPTLVASQVALANAPWASEPDMVRLDRLEVQLDLPSLLTGSPKIERVLLVRPSVRLERGPAGEANWQLEPAGAEATPPESQEPAASSSSGWLPTLGQLAIQDGLIVYRDGPAAPEFQLAIADASLRAPEPAGDARLDLTGTAAGLPLTAGGTIGPVATLTLGEPGKLDLRTELAAVDLVLAGTIGRAFDVALDLKAPELASLEPALSPWGVPSAQVAALAPLELRGRLMGDPSAMSLNGLALSAAGSDLAGKAKLDLAGGKPRLEADLVSRLIDLAHLLPPSTDDAAAEPQAEQELLFSREPLPLDALSAADGRLSVQVDELRTTAAPLRDIRLVAVLADARLQVEPLSATVPGGVLGGSLDLDAGSATPTVDVTAGGQNLALGEVLANFARLPGLEAAGDLQVRLHSQGASPQALAEQLDGRVSLLAGEGRMRLDLLDRLAAGLRQTLGTALGISGEFVPLHCLALDAPIARGIVRPDLVLNAIASSLSASGSVDLGRDRLELTLTPAARVAGVKAGVPIAVDGPLREPAISLDPTGAARNVVGALGGGFFPPEVANALGAPERRGSNPCLEGAAPAPAAGPTAVDPKKALDGAKSDLERAGKGLLQNFLQRR